MLKWLKRLFLPVEQRAERPEPLPEGTLYTRPATWEDVLAVARHLNRQGTRYVRVGGYALAAHGHVRMTEDVGIAVSPDPENARKWITALAEFPDGASTVPVTSWRGKRIRFRVITCMPYASTMNSLSMSCPL